MAKVITYPTMVLSAVGLLASVTLHVATLLAGRELPGQVIPVLFPGIFVVWLPTVLVMNRLTRDFKQKDIWKAALRGCPEWMTRTLWIIWGYAFLAAFILPFVLGRNPEASPASFVIFPAVFYSMSFAVMYSAAMSDQFDWSRHCLNGHTIPPLAKFCEECGAPASPDPRTLGPV
jgi:hypothetical protein